MHWSVADTCGVIARDVSPLGVVEPVGAWDVIAFDRAVLVPSIGERLSSHRRTTLLKLIRRLRLLRNEAGMHVDRGRRHAAGRLTGVSFFRRGPTGVRRAIRRSVQLGRIVSCRRDVALTELLASAASCDLSGHRVGGAHGWSGQDVSAGLRHDDPAVLRLEPRDETDLLLRPADVIPRQPEAVRLPQHRFAPVLFDLFRRKHVFAVGNAIARLAPLFVIRVNR